MKTKLSEPGYDRIPEDMRRRLEEALARVRRILRVRGILAVTATAAGLLLALMLLDASIALMPWGIRIGLSATAVALVLFTAWRQLYVPLRRRLDLTAIAQIIDKRHPELEERISSTVELLSTDLGADLRGSARLVSFFSPSASVLGCTAAVAACDPPGIRSYFSSPASVP